MDMPSSPPPEVVNQLETLDIERSRPLIISDADEVLVAFMAGLVAYLERNGMYFDWSSFALNGNIRRKRDSAPVEPDEVRAHLETFFVRHTAELDAVPGAARSLAALSERAQVVVLSNVPFAQRAMRKSCLARHGMDYPLIANVGSKGAAVGLMAARVAAPVFFLDDIPHNHTSVARVAEHVERVHFIADPRLAKLLGPAEDSHYRARDWEDLRGFIERRLDELGY